MLKSWLQDTLSCRLVAHRDRNPRTLNASEANAPCARGPFLMRLQVLTAEAYVTHSAGKFITWHTLPQEGTQVLDPNGAESTGSGIGHACWLVPQTAILVRTRRSSDAGTGHPLWGTANPETKNP